MATFKFNTYLDDLYVESGNWIVTQFSSSQITLEGAEFQIVLTGTSFAVGTSGAPLGTITGVKVYGYDYASGNPATTLVVDGSGLNHSLAGFVSALETGYHGGVDFLLNGNDTLNGSAGDDEMAGFGGNDTLNGGDGDDELFGDSWEWDYDSDSIVAGSDVLNGGNGNDWLDGGAGADSMSGGAGDDVFVVDNAGDKVIEAAGAGARDRVEFNNGQGLLSYTLAANVENLSVFHWMTSGTPSIMTAKGNDLSNKISVDPYGDMGLQEKLYGMGGNDRLFSGNGNDVLDGGTGNDIMLGGFGSDIYYVDSNLDKVLEEIIADPQSSDVDTVVYTVAVAGSTASLGGAVSGLTNSVVLSQIENLNLGLNTTTTTALNGVGSLAANKLIGNAAVNKLYGLAGNDQLYGYDGADQLFGDSGNDILVGGAGKDSLSGGAGNDIFDFNALSETGITNTTWDVITDFVRGQDRIDLSTLDANTATTTNDAFSAVIGSTTAFTAAGQLKVVSGVLYGNTDADSTAEFAIQLTGISSLSTADFIL
ncbi:calcium-binding protein [Pseudomonas oryzae]|uniref:Serralysin n=1 Tax=Pseudomonas oryzae TaxID=1392877 RepID=A0A1H1Y0Q8_9PSED|nr:calcium-binding protein [Pseudomonas oryzae]SDT14955.1 serralysin [Pseudomonas oryzae]